MPKWTPYISGERAVVVGGDYIYCYALTHEESVKFAAAHNADIDALTAERDELQRRLDAVVVGEPETDITKAVHGRLYMVMFPYLFGGIPESMYFWRDNDGKYFWGKYPPAQGGPLWGSHNTVAWFAEIRAIAEGRTE